MNAMQIAQSGLNANSVKQSASAHNVANLGTDGFSKQRSTHTEQKTGGVSTQVDTVTLSPQGKALSEQVDGSQNNVDLADEMVTQIEARENFKSNARVVRTQDDMQKTLLDTLA